MVYCYCDGGCNNETHSDAYGSFAIFTEPGANMDSWMTGRFFFLESKTSNEAEYDTLIKLLEFLTENQLLPAQIYCDSKLVVNQVKGTWACQAQNLQEKYIRTRELMSESIQINWVSRKQIVSILGH